MRCFAVLSLLVAAIWCAATESVVWPLEELKGTAPVVAEAPEYSSAEHPGVRGIFFDGMPWNGRPTRVFAYLGIPETQSEKLPAVILVHGGGGSAFRWWVERWMKRGYVALALDTTGGVPKDFGDVDQASASVRHPQGGPDSRRIFVDAGKPTSEQWPFHAVCAIIRANTLLRQLPQVDPDKIGVIGISWGAVMSEVAASLDNRFGFAIFVYGNGFLAESSSWAKNDFPKLSPENAVRWSSAWDPSRYLEKVNMPVLFCNGATDRHFHPDAWHRTAALVKPELRTLCCRPAMGHSHPAGDVPEVTVFADSITRGAPALPTIHAVSADTISISSARPLRRAELVYTTDSGEWPERKWRTMPAVIDGPKASAAIPADATAWYFTVINTDGRMVSSELQQRKM